MWNMALPAGLVLGLALSVSSADAADAPWSLGRGLYRGGGDAAVRVVLPGGVERPAQDFACAGCHGATGVGSGEGSMRAPGITWRILSQSSDGGGTRPHRPRYDPAALTAAVQDGIDPAGRPFVPAMPRYRAEDAVMSSLLAYLQVLGTAEDRDPGVQPDALRIGTALPLTGARAEAGQAVRAVLERFFATLNRDGGVYGREIILRVADSSAAPAKSVFRDLISTQDLFALLAPFDPNEGDASDIVANSDGIPFIGPITLAPWAAVPSRAQVYVLVPGLGDQARVLVDYLAEAEWPDGRHPRLAVMQSNGRVGQDALAGAEEQARLRGLSTVTRLDPSTSMAAAAFQIREAAIDAVLCFTPPAQSAELALALDRVGSEALLAISTQLLGDAITGLPPRVRSRVVLADPLNEPNSLPIQDVGAPGRGERRIAQAAAMVLTEALRQGGRDITRAGLELALRRLPAVRTGVLPPLGFTGGRIGNRAIAVIRLEPETGNVVTLAAARPPADGARP